MLDWAAEIAVALSASVVFGGFGLRLDSPLLFGARLACFCCEHMLYGQ